MYIIILYHIDFYHMMIFMSQFTETSEEVCFNSQKLLGKIIIPYLAG